MKEQGIIFNSNGRQLIAIEHLPLSTAQGSAKKGVVIVVGGPQTRVGSHRLFVQLARILAKQGVAVFRFDYSGAGDSEGKVSAFTDIQADIHAAINTFSQRHPDITELSLWGLCDAASAILLYINDYSQSSTSIKIKHLFLVNPWVRQVQTEAKVYLRSYYIKRLLSKSFWQKLLSGQVQAKLALTDIQNFHQQSQTSDIDSHDGFIVQMWLGLSQFSGKCHFLLSSNDLTADEFKLLITRNTQWREMMTSETITVQTIHNADHTFSQQHVKNQLMTLVCNTLQRK